MTNQGFFHSAYVQLTGLIALTLIAGNVYAFGNACKNVNFSVNNNYDRAVTVTKFELWSESEGRWLNDDFKNVVAPMGAQDFTVRKGETVEHAENDRITKIKVYYEYTVPGPLGEIPPRMETVKHTSTDTTISDPICVAGKWYNATISAQPDRP